MIIKGQVPERFPNRVDYHIDTVQDKIKHFAIWVTTPDKPFRPHKHDLLEMWYIIEGEAIVTLDGQDHPVSAGDLIYLAPWVEHGLRSETQCRWICLG